MSRDSYKPVGQRFTTHPFTLPVRPSYSWEDSRDRTNEQLHESAMRQFGLPQGTSVSTSVAASNESSEAVYQKWENRGLLIQKHERRLSDSNNLLAKMWRRLDPYGRVDDILSSNVVVRRYAEQRAEPAFSENPYMQGLFHRLAAYDYVNAVDPDFVMQSSVSMSASTSAAAIAADPGLTEKRLNSLATTVKIQSGLLQEKNEVIEKLRTQLTVQRKVHMQFNAHQKDKDDAIVRLEKQVHKASARISTLCNALSEVKPKSIAVPRAPRSSRTSRAVRAPRTTTPRLPEVAFGGIPENHQSLTFNGFSEQNAFNPARLQMLTSVNPPVDVFPEPTVMPEDDIFDVGPLSSGANRAPLGPLKRRYDSAMQSSHGSRTATPLSSRSSHVGLPERDAVVSQRDVVLLDYDDPVEVPRDSNKRFKSGVLTPPRPEDLVMGSIEEPAVKVEEVELEMGEIKEVPEVGPEHKFVYDGLDEMIQEAQKGAKV